MPISAPPLGPNNVTWLEEALRSVSHTPLSEPEKLSTVLLVSGFVRNDATLTADLAAAAAGGTNLTAVDADPGMLSLLTEASRFPALHRAISSGALDDDENPDVEFWFGLQRILDGVAVLIGDRGRD